jgi:uncharacterized membrane protein
VPTAALPPLSTDFEYCVVARRNDSLGTRRRWQVFGALALGSLGLAVAFAWAGAWLVLPYAVLEVGVLAAAFAYFERHAGDWERLSVLGDRVVVERAVAGRRERREFNRLWLRVEVSERGMSRMPHVTLHSAGVECAFGEALPARERMAVAKDLRRLVGARHSGR